MNLDREFALRLMSVDPLATSVPLDADRVRLHELRALFDVFLPGASDEEFEAVAVIQDDLQTQQLRLEALLDRRIIDAAEYAATVNNEASWCMRRAAAVLGESRTKRLFGVEDLKQVIVVDPLEMAVSPSVVGSDVTVVTRALLERYTRSEFERKQVRNAVARIDPQSWRAIVPDTWDENEKYGELVSIIGAAEEHYHVGALQASIQGATAVVNVVTTLDRISDAPLYLASWAYHIQGRCYEALADWRQASFSYGCSLAFKQSMEAWLPPLPVLATEIKLGAMQVFHSPVEAASRLKRVADRLELDTSLRDENRRLYSNLLEDARVGLAEAHLAAAKSEAAIQEAQSADAIARELHDRVGQVRIIFVLYRACAVTADSALQTIYGVLGSDADELAVHPRVARILGHLSRAVNESVDARQGSLFDSAD